MSSFSIRAFNLSGTSVISVEGDIFEDFRWSRLRWYSPDFKSVLPQQEQFGLDGLMDKLNIYLKEVRNINTTGLKLFRSRTLDIFSGRETELLELSIAAFEQAAMVPHAFIQKSHLRSVYAPYDCEVCDARIPVFVKDLDFIDDEAIQRLLLRKVECTTKRCKGVPELARHDPLHFWREFSKEALGERSRISR